MICGNEEGHIVACLDSARDAFDQLCLVRATGAAEPDRTLNVAFQWCQENAKPYRFDVYQNQRADLPHVDNFAAARNLSFALAVAAADSPWLLWLDCDDRLDRINCDRIRDAINFVEPGFDAVFCSYRIANQGSVIMRERIIRAGVGARWKGAVHETCTVPGQIINCPGIIVYHSEPGEKATRSSARNLAILEGITEGAPRHFFYLHAELMQLKRHAEASAAAQAALALLDESMVEERYLVHINLAMIAVDAGNTKSGVRHLLKAARIQPHRREAFGDLAQICLAQGRLSDAISWFRIMDALPLPEPLPWTHRGIWYGWARDYLRIKILRATGKLKEAEADHARYSQDALYAEATAVLEVGTPGS